MKNFWFCFLILIFLSPEQANTKNFKIEPFFKINTEDLNNFFLSLKISCKKNFYLKIKRNKLTTPFGTIKSWESLCNKIDKKNEFNTSFLKENFHLISNNQKPGLLTGYYEPLIEISKKKDGEFKFPILKKSKNLFGERKIILKSYNDENVLFWTNNNIDLFFLHIQGSGIGVFRNGEKRKIAYSGNNGFKYTSIGKILINSGKIKQRDISLQSIKQWLNKNSEKSEEIFNHNKRFIFFKDSGDFKSHSKGAMNIELVPNISIAIDSSIYPFGVPFLLKTDNFIFNKPVIAHDTGAAINGYNRADLFIGRGEEAEAVAGILKKNLKLFLLVPISEK